MMSGTIRVHRPPYKFLDYYDQQDADIFCGRDAESQAMVQLVLAHRLLTLFGPSGAGKTSLLLASILPRLAREGYRHIYIRALDDPLPAVRKAVAALADRIPLSLQGRGAGGEGEVRAFLLAVLSPDDKLVVVLDQFEEFFLRLGNPLRQHFWAELAAFYDQASGARSSDFSRSGEATEACPEQGRRVATTNGEPEVRFIFSLREDYLACLDEARSYLPDILSSSFRLTMLDRDCACLAITGPATRAGITVEPALVDTLVGRKEISDLRFQISDSGGGLVQADGTVLPPALQIVLDRLYCAALPAGHDPESPPPPGLELTLAGHRALGGASAILAGYLDDRLSGLGDMKGDDDTPLGADPALGEAMLKVMVTSQKAALTYDELLERLVETGALDPVDEADCRLADSTRLGLERARLLRDFQHGGETLYELAHDYVAIELARRIGQAEREARVARELLRHEMDNWRGAGLLIPLDVLKLIHECHGALRQLAKDELELLFRSALAAGYEAAFWYEHAHRRGVPADDIALEDIKSADFRRRAAGVIALAQLGSLQGEGKRFVEAIIEALADDYPQVRVAAILMLEKLRPHGVWRDRLAYECYVPAGMFIIGDDGSKEGNEKPAHEVYLDAFYVGRYPVTNADYKRYMNDQERPFEIPGAKADHPVGGISWYDARDYAAWASMRLLTEAEWEKAASWEEVDRGGLRGLAGRLVGGGNEGGRKQEAGGRKRKYPWGDEFDRSKCNTSEAVVGDTTPVGAYSPQGDSPYGCVDMAGNLWEWTSSLYRPFPYRADDGREDAFASGQRVVRGGSFHYCEANARCTVRFAKNPVPRSRFRGLRVGFTISVRT